MKYTEVMSPLYFVLEVFSLLQAGALEYVMVYVLFHRCPIITEGEAAYPIRETVSSAE